MQAAKPSTQAAPAPDAPVAEPLAVGEVDAGNPKVARILEAAHGAFMAEGYGAVSMDQIAKLAGVSKATVYSHFGSKEMLFATMVHEACRSFATGVFPQVVEEPDIAVAVRRIVAEIERFLMGDGPIQVYRIMVSEGPRFPELVRAWYETGPLPFRRTLAEFLRKATTDGRLVIPNPMLAADQLIGLVRGPLYFRRLFHLPPTPADPSPHEVVDGAVHVFLSAYRPR